MNTLVVKITEDSNVEEVIKGRIEAEGYKTLYYQFSLDLGQEVSEGEETLLGAGTFTLSRSALFEGAPIIEGHNEAINLIANTVLVAMIARHDVGWVRKITVINKHEVKMRLEAYPELLALLEEYAT